MTKNTIRILMPAIALLVLTGCNAAKTAIEQKAGNAITKTVNEVNRNLESDEGESNAESDDSGSTTDLDECMKGCSFLSGAGMFSKEFCQDSCWSGVAKDRKDISICDTKVDPKNDLVQAACRMNVAEATLNPKDCEGIGASSDDMLRISCITTVAKGKNDPAICDGITNDMFKSICQEDVNSAE